VDIDNHAVEGKTRTLKASWSIDDYSDFMYSVKDTRKSLKRFLKVEGLKPRWFGLESKKSMVRRLDKKFDDRFADAIREEIDREILDCINKLK
jgi:hypothetical protein